MLNYLFGEIYRLIHKKSMYLYFASLALGYVLLAYIRSGGFSENSIVNDAVNFFFYLPILVGGFLFSAIYTDDLGSKNLISLVGFGLSKVKIIISKLILTTLFSGIIFALAPPLHIVVYGIFGSTAVANVWLMVYAISIKFWLMTVGFSALCGIIVYGLQRTTFAFVTYILLAFGIISGLINTAFNAFAPFLKRFLLSGITDGIMFGITNGSSIVWPIVEYMIYLVIAIVLSVLAFSKKEMEF